MLHSWRLSLSLLLCMPMFTACPSPVPDVEPTDTFEIRDPIDAFRLDELREVNATYTATSELCYWCHRNLDNGRAMRDEQGRPISPWDLWRGSIMANSARDPFFRATVSAEQASLPQGAEDISGECMACHAPAAFAEATLAGQPAPTIDVLSGSDDLALLARDGGTCVGCHLLDPSKAGDEDTWSGHHAYNSDRLMYGPHTEPNARPMQNFAQFTPTHHENATEAGMCASCHMLQTEAVDASGAKSGHVLTEQAPFVEWRSSVFNPERGGDQAQTCQDCHLPTVDMDGNLIETRIAGGLNVGNIPERAPFGRHLLVGGNAFVLEVLYDNRG
ncbi:MAG: multiheme c-type cytochrome, partial [Myxococcota bacterium]